MKKEKDENNKNCALIIANGTIRDYERIRELMSSYCRNDPIIISADGGIENTYKLGLKPHIVIGDMDSLDRKKYEKLSSGVRFISADPEKDESDTRLAVEYARDKGIRDIIIIGAAGGRLDHTFANMLILASPELKYASVKIITEDSEISCMHGSGKISGKAGNIISIFSLAPYTSFIKTSGLKYPLVGEKLYQSPVRGLSNVFTSDEASLEFDKGRLLIIKQI